MASTNKTTNYELSQFEGTDKPSWEADYNADMLIIDTNLKAVSDVADGASGSISTLADRVTTAEGNISTNANDIDALEARADALEAGETTADGRLDALEAEQLIQNTAIEGNTQLGYNLARPYDSASTYAVGAYVLFQNTLYKCTTAVSTGEAFDPNKWLAIKATDEISAGGYTLPTASASTLGGVKVGSGLSINPSTGVLSASGGGGGATVTVLNTNNFSITTTEVKANIGGSVSYPTISNFAWNTGSSSAALFAEIGDLKILKMGNVTIDLDPALSIPANSNVQLDVTIQAAPSLTGIPAEMLISDYGVATQPPYVETSVSLRLNSDGTVVLSFSHRNNTGSAKSITRFAGFFPYLIYTIPNP